MNQTRLFKFFQNTRKRTEVICEPLLEADYNLQPVEYVSPAKWHLAHTTWFFETFVLKRQNLYQEFHPDFTFLFNSYYEHEGERLERSSRSTISRPTIKEVYKYREYVNNYIEILLRQNLSKELRELIELGCQHEQQHQELLYTDLKYSFSINPIFPKHKNSILPKEEQKKDWLSIPEGVYEIGHQDKGFCFDNELGVHKVYLHNYKIQNGLVTNEEYCQFIEAGGYENFSLWLSEGWNWVKNNQIQKPLYWIKKANELYEFTLGGLRKLDKNAPVAHMSFYEADAFANWKQKRLPTEFEWEVASAKLNYGKLWEWTSSAYLPYRGFKIAQGSIGEYNGKWMVNQKVLRGGSVASPENHLRKTYRNFFHADKRWQFSGIRLAESI